MRILPPEAEASERGDRTETKRRTNDEEEDNHTSWLRQEIDDTYLLNALMNDLAIIAGAALVGYICGRRKIE
jgi:hypothetical protein